MMVDTLLSKQGIRRTAADRRSRIPDAQLVASGSLLLHACMPVIASLPARTTLSIHVSMGNEIDTLPLLRHIVQTGRRAVIPRLGGGLDIGWSALNDPEDLDLLTDVTPRLSKTLRPREPGGLDTLPPSALSEASCVFIPAYAVDRQGNRVGRGAGWYDRALKYRDPHTLLVAVCWPWERLEQSIPAQSHDIPVQAVATTQSLSMLHP